MCRKAKCLYCNNEGTVKISLAARGGRAAYLCDYHASTMGDEGYSRENDKRRGNANHGFTFSLELEMHNPTPAMRAELESVGFIPTADCTTDTEFKSPIYESLKPLPKKLATLEAMLEGGHGNITEADGTHFHVGHKDSINPQTMDYLKRFYHSLFVPLCEAMKADPEATEKLFGRNFVYYASPINTSTNPMNHANFINLQHSYTIEFRLCKFQNAEQYVKVAKFCKDCTNAIIANFIEHFNDEEFDTRRYSNKTEYRKHKASVTAQKLVKLFEKYTA